MKNDGEGAPSCGESQEVQRDPDSWLKMNFTSPGSGGEQEAACGSDKKLQSTVFPAESLLAWFLQSHHSKQNFI